uniref:Uncharacterized protein n=1 Tax=Cacopsylla melanoneura TaxID=428564 RepID=A0A8D8QL48_9HEMI
MILELFFDTQKFSSIYLQRSIVFNCNYFPYSSAFLIAVGTLIMSMFSSVPYVLCILCVHYIMHTGLNICLNNECTIHFNAKYTPTFVVFMLSFIFTLTLFKI